jgi:protein FAM50
MKENVGLVTLSELKKRKAEAQRELEQKAALRELTQKEELVETTKKRKTDTANKQQPTKSKKAVKPKIARLSFEQDEVVGGEEEEEEEEDDDVEKETERTVKRVKGKRDPTIDTSELKTKKEQEQEQRLKEQTQLELLAQHAKAKSEIIDFPFVYYDGSSTPSKVTVKKGDPIWVILDKTRKGRKQFHRGTVDDILLVKNNIIIPHVSRI